MRKNERDRNRESEIKRYTPQRHLTNLNPFPDEETRKMIQLKNE